MNDRFKRRLITVIVMAGFATAIIFLAKAAFPGFAPIFAWKLSPRSPGGQTSTAMRVNAAFASNTNVEWRAVDEDPKSKQINRLSKDHPDPSGPAIARTKIKQAAGRIALEFLEENSRSFGIRDMADVKIAAIDIYDYPDEYKERGFDAAVQAIQQYKGVPVLYSFNRLVMDKAGEIFIAKNNWYPKITAPTRPKLSVEEAVAATQGHLKTSDQPTEAPELWIVPSGPLVYRMTFGGSVKKEILVDATTGAIFKAESNVTSNVTLNGIARTADGNPLPDLRVELEAVGEDIQAEAFTGADGRYSIVTPFLGDNYVTGFAESTILGETRNVVRDGTSDQPIYDAMSSFTTEDGKVYTEISQPELALDFNEIATPDASEGAVLFREMNRAFRYVADN